MATGDVCLPDDLLEFVESQAASKGYESGAAYVVSLVREARLRKAREDLEAKLAEGLRGSFGELSEQEWESIQREADEGLAGETIHA